MKIKLKNQPRLRLVDLLRRRKMTLQQFLNEFGITTYVGLSEKCARLGVVPPTEVDFDALGLEKVNDPLNGVIVVESSRKIEQDEFDDKVDAYPSNAAFQTLDEKVDQRQKKQPKKVSRKVEDA